MPRTWADAGFCIWLQEAVCLVWVGWHPKLSWDDFWQFIAMSFILSPSCHGEGLQCFLWGAREQRCVRIPGLDCTSWVKGRWAFPTVTLWLSPPPSLLRIGSGTCAVTVPISLPGRHSDFFSRKSLETRATVSEITWSCFRVIFSSGLLFLWLIFLCQLWTGLLLCGCNGLEFSFWFW